MMNDPFSPFSRPRIVTNSEPFTPPTPAEVFDFCQRNNFNPRYSNGFLDKWNAAGWRFPNGDPVTKWEGLLMRWLQRGMQYEQQHGGTRYDAMVNPAPAPETPEESNFERVKAAYEKLLDERAAIVEELSEWKDKYNKLIMSLKSIMEEYD